MVIEPHPTVAATGIDRFVVTANLLQAHAPWLTETFVELQVSGLTADWEQCLRWIAGPRDGPPG